MLLTCFVYDMQGLLEDPDYEHVKEGYEAAHEYANRLVASRLPQPRLVVCDQGTSQARFLLARLNPSQTQQNTDGQDVGSVIFTDDVSFDVFMEQLRKLIVGKAS
jgi:protein transport protein SEC23